MKGQFFIEPTMLKELPVRALHAILLLGVRIVQMFTIYVKGRLRSRAFAQQYSLIGKDREAIGDATAT